MSEALHIDVWRLPASRIGYERTVAKPAQTGPLAFARAPERSARFNDAAKGSLAAASGKFYMSDIFTARRAAFVLRFALSGLLLFHAGAMIFDVSSGTAPALAEFAIAAELVGACALLFGLWSPLAAVALVPIFLGVVVIVHSAAHSAPVSADGLSQITATMSRRPF